MYNKYNIDVFVSFLSYKNDIHLVSNVAIKKNV